MRELQESGYERFLIGCRDENWPEIEPYLHAYVRQRFVGHFAMDPAAASIAAATRAKTHLAADTISRNYSDNTRQWLARAGALFGLIPWSIIVLMTSWNIVRDSTLLQEHFPDTGNPGYFIIKLALLLLALLVLIEGMIELVRPVIANDGGPTSQ